MKNLINKILLKYVKKNKKLQNEIVNEWCSENEIAKYYITNSDVNLKNVNMIYSTISNCIVKQISDSNLSNSPLNIITDGMLMSKVNMEETK